MTNENINSDKEAVNLKYRAERAEDIRQEALLGCAKSQYLLGMIYMTGDGLEQETFSGLEWVMLSANKEYQPAIDWLKKLSEEYSDAESSGHIKVLKSSMSKRDLVVLVMSGISFALFSFALWLFIICL